MQKTSEILFISVFIILLILTVHALYLHYQVQLESTNLHQNKNQKIGYFNINLVQQQCKVFKKMNEELEKEEKKNKEITQEYREKLLKKVDEFEKNNRGKSKLELSKIQSDINILEDDIHHRIDYHSKSYTLKNYQIKKEIKKRITAFLRQYCKEKGYTFIFETESDLVFYKDQAYDITQDIIDGITLEDKLQVQK